MFGKSLSKKLNKAYFGTSLGKALSVHMFGIKHAVELDGYGSSAFCDLLEEAGVPVSYQVELNKARNIGRVLIDQGVDVSKLN